MIITQFRKFTPLNIGFLVLVGGVLCLGIFPSLPAALPEPLVGPVLVELFPGSWTVAMPPELNVVAALVLTILQALYLNAVFNRYNFFNKPTFLIALMYMTLASLALPFLVLSPVLLCNFIGIWVIDKLLKIYHRQVVLRDMYDLGLLVGVGSLLYLPFISMIVGLCFALRIYRPFNWREWMAPFLGLITIYFSVAVLYLWFDKEQQLLSLWESVGNFSLPPIAFESYHNLVFLPVLIILMLFLVVLRETFFKRIVHIRKTVQMLFVLLLLSLLSVFLYRGTEHYILHLLLSVPVLSVYCAYYFNYAQRKWLFEGLYLTLLLVILLVHFL